MFFFQGEDQWEEAAHGDGSNVVPGGAIVKGPTMPSEADLQQIVTMKDFIFFYFE